MKKLLWYLIIGFISISLIGCSSDKKSDEERKDEIRAEMEAELESNEGTEKSQQLNDKQSTENNDDDLNSVFQFISSQYPEYTQEDFNKWTANFYDLNGSGSDEIIFATTYFDGKLEEAIVITEDHGEFEEVPSFIPLAKYENTIGFEDGFLVNKIKSGGSGAFNLEMNLYVYDGHKMIDVLDQSILIEETVAAPTVDYHITSEISGTLKDFVIEHTKKDNQTDFEEMTARDRYVYDEESTYFWRTPLSISNTAKSFEQVYNGTSLKDTIEYFNENLYNFNEEGLREFSTQMMKVIEQDKLKMFPMNDSPFHYISSDAYNIETNELDVSNIDEYTKDVLAYMEKRGIYKLAKSFYANQGEISESGYDVIIDYWMFEMMKPAIGFAYPDRYRPNDYTAIEPFVAPNFQLYSAKQVENSMIVYPNILAASYDDVMKLKNADTWKAKVFLPVEIVNK